MFSKKPVSVVFILMMTSVLFSGCGGKGEDTAIVEQVENEIIQAQEGDINEVPANTVTQSSAMTYVAGGQGIVYQKVAPMKVMGSGKTFNVYTDAKAGDNHYTPSGWMGDYGDLKINDRYLNNPHSGISCIQIVYLNRSSQGARWAGIYWQNPANNWGNRPGGYDLTGATSLTFWVRGENGGERIEEFKVGGITGEFGDSDVAGIGPVTLTKDWQKFTVDLTGKDLSSISGGFCWASNLDVNPDGATFYIDDVRYE